MTLIISVLTEQYVALMSDRRITWIQDKKIKRQEDSDTKTFNLFGQFLMGFTGVARIDGWRIERWAMEIFRGVPTSEYFDVLSREITAVFRRNDASGKVPHAFHAVGYAGFKPGGRVYPLSVTVSNSLDKQGMFSPEALGDSFRTFIEPLGNRRQMVRSVGWPMRQTTQRALSHRLRVVAKGDATNPALSVGPLLMALRDTARVSKEHVGKAALFASLPRSAVPSPGMAMGQIDYRRQAASLFIPETAHGAGEGILYMPAIINPNLMIAGIKMYSGMPKEPLGQEEGFS